MASTAAPSHALSLPSPLLSRAPRPLPLFSAQQRFIAKASELPFAGNTAPDFKAEAVFDQGCTNNKMQHTTSTLLPSLLTPTPKIHHFMCSATITTPKPLHTASLAPKPTTKHVTHPHNDFQEKLLYLDSLGLDYLTLLNSHPPLLTSPLSNLKSLIDHLTFLTLTPLELQRIFGMCPQLLTLSRKDIAPVLSFLLREVRIPHTQLKKAINRRPRLLLSDVHTRLRPTLYFLQRIGVEDLARHTHLLSCSVEDKFLPRIEYFEAIGFENGDAVAMFRRFPQLFCYSVEGNFKPKVDYFLGEMGRELGELKEFPQYFSFSLEKRIKPRHQRCVEKGVCFPLPFLLKSNEGRFQDRLNSCFGSSLPVKDSPLWCTNSESKLPLVGKTVLNFKAKALFD